MLCVFSFFLFVILVYGECPCNDKSLCEPLKIPPRKEFIVFGSYDEYHNYDWTYLTTIALWSGTYDPDIVCYAHARGVRLVIPTSFSVSDLGNVTAQNIWIDSLVKDVKDKYFDGVNFDFEDEIKLSSPQVELLTSLTQQLSKTFHEEIPGSQVSFDVAWAPTCIDVRCYDYKALALATDFLVVMDYDEQSQIFGPCRAGPTSSLPYLVQGMQEFMSLGISEDKLVMGLPWYGHDFKCVSPVNITVCPLAFGPWRGVKCTDAGSPEIVYSEIISKYVPISRVMWDQVSASPWLNYNDSTGIEHQLWFDTPKSLSIKSLAAKQMKLRGVSVFRVDYVDYNDPQQVAEMWGSLNIFFS
eukprot:TRINITY_DN4043_c0_g1_i10.p1 TRINITY_DN4043_c0_g1~~TRINITY_DN4043_c0_g1_i10.p1  ORF type:complete len:356 (-),score=50.55 TRINITY_DN4043_c0_g1_i10:1611-2678(-)